LTNLLCLQSTNPDRTDLIQLTSDALHFIQQFSVGIIHNPLHIYASALPFTPVDCALRKAYITLFPDIPQVITGLDSHWPVDSILRGASPPGFNEIHIGSITFSPDASRIAVSSGHRSVRVWHLLSGTHVDLNHSSGVTAVVFSPDGCVLASCSLDGSIGIWDAMARGTPINELSSNNCTHPMMSIAISSDNQFVATGSLTGCIHVWDLKVASRPERRLSRHTTRVCSLVFLSDVAQMASCSVDGMVCIWDMQTWECIRQPLNRHLYGVLSIVFSSCGSRIAIWFVDGSLRFQNIEPNNDEQSEALPSGSVSIIVSPDQGSRITFSTDHSPRYHPAGSDFLVSMNIADEQMRFTFAAFSPIDSQIIARCADGIIRLCNFTTSPPAFQVVSTNKGTKGPVAFTDDGSQIGFCARDGSIQTWDLESERLRSIPSTIPGHMPLMLSFSPDKLYIAASYEDGYLLVWNVDEGIITWQFQEEGKWVNVVTFSPGQHLIAIGTSTGTCVVYDYIEGRSVFVQDAWDESGPILKLELGGEPLSLKRVGLGITPEWYVASGSHCSTHYGGDFGGIVSAAFSPDGSKVASASGTGQVTVWDSLTGDPTVTFICRESQNMAAVAFSADSGRVCALSNAFKGIVRVWTIDGQQQAISGESNSNKLVTSAKVACSGNRIAVLREDGTLLLHGATSISHAIFTLPQTRLYQFSSDGKLLASCSLDGYLQVQETDSGHLISRCPVNGSTVLEFSPNSQQIVTVDDMDVIQVWDAGTEFNEGRNLGKAFGTAAKDVTIYGSPNATGHPVHNWPPDVHFTADSAGLLNYFYPDGKTTKLRMLDMDGSLRYEGDNSYLCADGSRIVQLVTFAAELETYDTVRVLDVTTLSIVFEGHGLCDIAMLAISPDGLFVAGSPEGPEDDTILVWKLDAGRAAWRILHDDITAMVFSPDSTMLATFDGCDRFCAWRLETGELAACKSASFLWHSVEFSLDHFVRHLSDEDGPLYALSGFFGVDDDWFVRTGDFKKVLWIPFDFRGETSTGGQTAVITTTDKRLVLIRMGNE
jgi:WD40 repeat protein